MDFDDPALQQVLADYERRYAEEEDTRGRVDLHNRDQCLLAVGPATARLLNLLIKESRARAILEIGTSYGYSTLWLAEAARQTGGRVTTLDLHGYKQDYAKQQLSRAGLAEFVDFRSGDAMETLEKLPGPFDFVLLDLWKDMYIPCLDLFYPKLSPGALIVADNMTFPESSLAHAALYRQHVRSRPGIQSVLLPVGSGIEVSRYL
jgi:predicted O-methyltransferase YrrM